MNLIQGRRVEAQEMADVMERLPRDIEATLQKPPLDPQVVVEACDRLVATLPEAMVLPVLESLGMGPGQAKARFEELGQMFKKEYLFQRLAVELGPDYGKTVSRTPYGLKGRVQQARYPLGVLFHIAAGNMDGLPVYSVIEGLLAGNINLLKLPAVDGGLSVLLLEGLFAIEPRLAEYVYVFELSSGETASLRQLAELANAVVVWGGDEAVQAVRAMAPPNVRVIEWGHKLSFAYATPKGLTKENLEGLAHGICDTNQLLCSSCQGVFIDTSDVAVARRFCTEFLPVLQRVSAGYPAVPLSARAQNTLQLYTRGLEKTGAGDTELFRGGGVSLSLEADSELTLSLQFRNLWVKRLPQAEMIKTLHPHKNHLQTAGLLCADTEWDALRDKLWRAGVVRVSTGGEMSGGYCGAAHDGEYPLQRYTRLVAAQR